MPGRTTLSWRLAAAPLAALLASLLAPPGAVAQTNGKGVTVIVNSEPDSIDSCMAPQSNAGRVVMQNVVETLVQRDPNTGVLEPRLATAWKQIDDKTWRFTLRPNVKFHDGTPLNAENAVKSIARTMDKSLNCEIRVKTFSGQTVTAKPVSEYEFDLSVDQPDPILPIRASSVTLSSPNTPVGKLDRAPAGTGPYVFDHWNAGQEIVLKRNESYWGKKPVVEGARYIWRNESAVSAAMVKLGEGDLTPNIAVQDANDPSMDFSYLNSETTYLRIDSLPPLNDKRLRQALNYAFDRNSMRGSVLSKDVINATQMVVPGVAGHNDAIDKMVYPFDPAKAKQLLAEAKAAGVPVDTQLELQFRPALFIGTAEVAEAIQAMYTAVGLNIKLGSYDEATGRALSQKPWAPGRIPNLMISSHDNNKGDPAFSMTFKYGCDGPQSMTCAPEVDKMIADASITPAGTERIAKWQKLFAALYQDYVSEVWLYHMVGYARVNPRITFKPDITTNSEVRLETISFK